MEVCITIRYAYWLQDRLLLYVPLQLVGVTHDLLIQNVHQPIYVLFSLVSSSSEVLYNRFIIHLMDAERGVHPHFEDVKVEPNPAYGKVTQHKAQTQPQPYEEFVAI